MNTVASNMRAKAFIVIRAQRSLIRVLQKSEMIERTSENKRTGAWRLAQK